MKKETSQQIALYRKLGENIRKCRTQRKLSQDELAKLVGLNRTSMTNIEKGRQHPPLHTLCEIIEHLKVDISELLPRSTAMQDPLDLRALARPQVRGDEELAFIETAIKGGKAYGDTKK
jgi:DNA-binding XRE family transcriptional regulator